ncbi:MAG: hypothetical protein PVG39_15110 [Desulfobacteraceae bacterium]|jgi:hypothetical protein
MKFEESIYTFLKILKNYDYEISVLDQIWELIFPDNKSRWSHLRVTRYKKVYYLYHIDGKSCSLEVIPGKSVNVMNSFGFSSYEDGRDDPEGVWGPMVKSALTWLKKISKDWMKANRLVLEQYPLNRRFGTVPHALIKATFPEFYKLDKELGKIKSRRFIRLLEEGYFLKKENFIRESMTAKDYFNYCRLAYIAGRRKEDHVDESLSGREMYKRYADGRHEGLLDINENSSLEFSDWIDGKHPKRLTGGHPWEIKRGGNTTHIDLSVFRPFPSKEGFKVELRGESIGRLKETINMFLGIYGASLPISISDPEGIRRRLLAQDNIGIIPSYESLHRANQHFNKDKHVYDVAYYNDLGRYKRRITPFISWEPLPLLKPLDVKTL